MLVTSVNSDTTTYTLSRSQFAKFPVDIIGYISKSHFQITKQANPIPEESKEESQSDNSSSVNEAAFGTALDTLRAMTPESKKVESSQPA